MCFNPLWDSGRCQVAFGTTHDPLRKPTVANPNSAVSKPGKVADNPTKTTMPSAGRSECLSGVVEIIDGSTPIKPDTFGDEASLQLRSANLHRLARMGPPDVAYFRKRFRPVVGASTVHGYYHFVRGVDVGSAASISAYLVDLVNNGLDALPWVNTGTWEVVGATYRSYNAISKVDVVVDLKLPGGISAHAIDSSGTKIEVTDTIWKETAVCAVIRDLNAAGEHPLYPCLRVMQTPFERMEEEFLDNARACVESWQNLPPTPASDGPAPSDARVANAISEHFLSFCRYDRAIKFFDSEIISLACRDAQVYVAAAHRLKKDLEAAEVCIGKALEANPGSSLALIGSSKIHSAKGELEEAWTMANKACEAAGADINTFITLADLSADLHKYPEALVALNSGNMPQLELDYYLRELVLKRRSKTSPSAGGSNGYDVISKLAQRLKKERNVFNSKCDDNLSELPGHMMTSTEQDCYSVLVKILADVGWDKLLAIRGEAFVMETDIETKNAEAAAAAAARKAAEKEVESMGDNEETDADSKENGADSPSAKDGADSSETGKEATSSPTEKESDAAAAEASEANGMKSDAAETENKAPNENKPEADDKTDKAATSPKAEAAEGDADKPTTESPNSKPVSAADIGKVVCKPWLDYLVTVMYEDLRAMAVWNAEERTQVIKALKKSKSANDGSPSPAASSSSVKAESSDDLEAGKEIPKRTPDEIASTTRRHAADWLRRGELALRLQKTEEAKSAFWICVKLSDKAKVPAVSAHLNLMNLAAREGDAVTTIMCADVIWSYLDSVVDKKSSTPSTPTKTAAPPVRVIQRAMFNLTAKLGLRSVREILATLDVDRHRIGTVLLDAVSWNVHGYST